MTWKKPWRNNWAVRSQAEGLESLANPIMQKIYAAAGEAPGGVPSGFPDWRFPGDETPGAGSHGAPNVEEVD